MLPQGIPLKNYTDWSYGKTTESSKTQKLTVKSYQYRIYFYEYSSDSQWSGIDTKTDESTKKARSVASFFAKDGSVISSRNRGGSSTSRYRYNGKTKKEIATDIANNMIAEISTLLSGTGISFTMNHYSKVPGDSGYSIEDEDAYYTTHVYPWISSDNSYWAINGDTSQFSRIVLYNKSSDGFFASTSKDSIRVIGHLGWYKDNYNYMLSGLRHEINQHALGLGHKDRMQDTSDGSYKLGNNNIAFMPLQRGFIHSGETTEDAVSGLWTVYGVAATLKITGQLKNDDNNKKWFWDGYGTAYIVDHVKKECMYQSPIDQNGYFEFRLAVLPPSTINHSILICSGEFLYWYIHSKKESDGTYSYVKLPAKRTAAIKSSASNGWEYSFDPTSAGEGEIRYYYKSLGTLSAGTLSAGTLIDAYGEGKSAKTLSAIYNETGFHMEYSGFATSIGNRQSMGSIVKRVGNKYECIRSHISTTATMPGSSGDDWKSIWQVTSEAANAGDWASGEEYKSKYRDEEESGSVVYESGSTKYRCKVK